MFGFRAIRISAGFIGATVRKCVGDGVDRAN
jgi:hypothetical protein